MSGHSKWHNIQKTKGAADAKRSAAFTKIAKEIIAALALIFSCLCRDSIMKSKKLLKKK